jgi:rfaE bifunctional protein kinase chain/domain
LGSKVFVAINVKDKDESNINFSESIIKSFPIAVNVVRYTNLEDLLRELQPNIVVRGQEFKNLPDKESDLIRLLGIKLMFGSGSTHLSEDDLNFQPNSEILLRETFRDYAKLRGFNAQSLRETVRDFSDKKVLVVGDLIIDEFISCQSIGMSQEDPVVVSTPLGSSRFIGGAGIVAAHCKALGADVSLVSLSGNDEPAEWAQEYLAGNGVKTRFVLDANRPTVVKQRFKNANQTLFRLTHFRPEEAEKQELEKIISYVTESIQDYDLLVFSDFSYGTLHPFVVSSLGKKIKQQENLFTAADSQSSSQIGSLSKFKHIDLVTPTEYEARLELRNDIDGIAILTQQLASTLKANSIILKLGADGVLLGGYKYGSEVLSTDRIPSANSRAIDVSGAGDSLLAVSSLSMACGRSLQEAAYLGSLASGIQVSRKGNIPIQFEEVDIIIDQIFRA